jgi:hypothetical protein
MGTEVPGITEYALVVTAAQSTTPVVEQTRGTPA